MALVPWVDAAYAPTDTQAQQAYNQGNRAVGFYLPGIPGTDPLNTWTPAQAAVCRAAGLTPVPICVPDPHLDADPVSTAQAAFHVATTQFGLPTECSILYDGPHLVNTGKITGPVWLPLPGNPPTAVGAGSAVQWGQTTISGWSVDTDTAAADFPFDRGIVCDMEHAVLNYRTVDEAVAWYQAFQAEIARLAATPDPVPHIGKERRMFVAATKPIANNSKAYLVADNTKVYLPDPSDLPALLGACGQSSLTPLSQATLDAIPDRA